MATTAITPELLSLNTASADLPDADGGAGNGIVATTPSDGWSISRISPEDSLIFRLTVDASGDTFVFTAGDRNISQRSALGNLSVTLAASDSRFICVEAARFMQDDGTMVVTATDAGSALTALIVPHKEQRINAM